MDRMNKSGLVTDVDTDYQMGMPEVRVAPDRARASARGVTVTNIADTISATVGSLRVGKYTDESGRRNDIRIKLLDQYNRRAERHQPHQGAEHPRRDRQPLQRRQHQRKAVAT